MALSRAEKKRITEEEVFRERVRGKIKRGETVEDRDKSDAAGINGLTVFCAVIVLAVIWVFWPSEPKTPEQQAIQRAEQRAKDCKDPSYAHTMSEAFVKDRLLAPTTADFSSYRDSTVTYLGDCTHLVSGYVDAQNSFGAQIRKRYIIKVKRIDGTNYELIELLM